MPPKLTRRGIAMMLVLSIALILGAFGLMLSRMNQGARREVDTLSGHLRALSVADACYADVVSRLSATGWENRWFKGGPEVRRDVVAAGGKYSYMLRDAVDAPRTPVLPGLSVVMAPGIADLLVEASWETSKVVLFWRLQVPTEGLDEFARVVPTAFVQAPDGTGTASIDPIAQKLGPLADKRRRNRGGFEALRPALRDAKGAGDVAAALDAKPKGPVVSDPPDDAGNGPRTKDYPGQVAGGLAPPPPPVDKGTWKNVPWRQWRNGGPGGTGTRTGIADRKDRGKEAEIAPWDDWTGWRAPAAAPGGKQFGRRRKDWDRKSDGDGGYKKGDYDEDGPRPGGGGGWGGWGDDGWGGGGGGGWGDGD